MALKCTGKGFLRGVPRRNLNDKEVEQYGGEDFLLSTRLYFKETFVFDKSKAAGYSLDKGINKATENPYPFDKEIERSPKMTDKREGQLPAAPEKPKRKKGKRDNTLTEG